MPYQIDFWGGDLHQNHVGEYYSTDWSEVQNKMQEAVNAGLLCNVLHTDFICPPEKVEQQKDLLAAYLTDAQPETLAWAVVGDKLIDVLHCCDTEAQQIAYRIAGPRGEPCRHPDGVQVLEDAETIIRAAIRVLDDAAPE